MTGKTIFSGLIVGALVAFVAWIAFGEYLRSSTRLIFGGEAIPHNAIGNDSLWDRITDVFQRSPLPVDEFPIGNFQFPDEPFPTEQAQNIMVVNRIYT